jgi:hypothetical protein
LTDGGTHENLHENGERLWIAFTTKTHRGDPRGTVIVPRRLSPAILRRRLAESSPAAKQRSAMRRTSQSVEELIRPTFS